MDRDSKNENVEDLLRQLIRENQASVGAATRTTHAVRAIYTLFLVILVTSMSGGLLVVLGLTIGVQFTVVLGALVIVTGWLLAAFTGNREIAKSHLPNSGALPKSNKASRKEPLSKKLEFEVSGSAPSTDSGGRIIVKLKDGKPGLTIGVDLSQLDVDLADKLAGKAREDTYFYNLTQVVRLRLNSSSEPENSVLVETTDGEFIGWILEDYSKNAAHALSEISSELRIKSSDLVSANFTFEVSARMKGWWYDWNDGDVGGRSAEIETMDVFIKTPFETLAD